MDQFLIFLFIYLDCVNNIIKRGIISEINHNRIKFKLLGLLKIRKNFKMLIQNFSLLNNPKPRNNKCQN